MKIHGEIASNSEEEEICHAVTNGNVYFENKIGFGKKLLLTIGSKKTNIRTKNNN